MLQISFYKKKYCGVESFCK